MIPIIPTGKSGGDIVITSDTHFDHGNIIKYCNRPFRCPKDQAEWERRGGKWHTGDWKNPDDYWRISQDSVDLMNDTMIKAANAVCTPDTTLIHLGDFCAWPRRDRASERRYIARCRYLRDQLKAGRVCLIWGNHDRPDLIQDDIFDWA